MVITAKTLFSCVYCVYVNEMDKSWLIGIPESGLMVAEVGVLYRTMSIYHIIDQIRTSLRSCQVCKMATIRPGE